MFLVYWMRETNWEERVFDETKLVTSDCLSFNSDEMTSAMKFMETLRKQQRDGGTVSFITMCSENPNSVGNPGVDETGPDYNWTKRRGNMPGLKK